GSWAAPPERPSAPLWFGFPARVGPACRACRAGPEGPSQRSVFRNNFQPALLQVPPGRRDLLGRDLKGKQALGISQRLSTSAASGPARQAGPTSAPRNRSDRIPSN